MNENILNRPLVGLLLVLGLVVGAPPALAQERALNVDNVPTLTLQECLDIALRENLALAAQREAQTSAVETEAASLRQMWPSLSLSSKRTDILQNEASGGSDAESYQTTLTLSQTLYAGESLWGSWQSDKIAVRQAELDVVRERRSLVQEVKAAWYSLLEADHLYNEAVNSLERLKQHARNAQAFYEEGRYWRNEVLQAQVEVARGEQKVIEAENTLKIARSTLNRLLRRPLSAPFDFDGELIWQELEWTLEDAFAHARAHRADLENTRLDIETSEWSETVARADMLPSVSLSGTYTVDGEDLSHDVQSAKTTVTVTVSWDFWQWGLTRHEVAAERAAVRESQLTYDDDLDAAMLEVQEAFLNAEEAAKKVNVLQQALEQAEENFRVNQVRYREQLGGANDVLDAQELLTDTRNNYISAMASYLTALATLDLAVGADDSPASSGMTDAGNGSAPTAIPAATASPAPD